MCDKNEKDSAGSPLAPVRTATSHAAALWIARATLLLCTGLALSACGQKGPLKLPVTPVTNAMTPSAQPTDPAASGTR